MSKTFVRDQLPALMVLAALTLGGSSSGGILANAALQLFSVAVLVVILLLRPLLAVPRGLTILALAICVLPALQLIPLPEAIWSLLPGRGEVAAGFDLVGIARPWLPISLDQDATLAVLVNLLPPLAGLVVFAQASARGLHWALSCLVACALGSILLGLAQQAAGEGTALQPYAITNPGHATGLFANRNHLGTLLIVAMPCAVLLLRKAGSRWFGAGLVVLLLAGAVLTGSRAAVVLGVLSALASLLWVGGIPAHRQLAIPGLVLGLALCAIGGRWLLTDEAMSPPGGADEHRPVIIATTLKAAGDYFPVGSGGGSFLRVYQHYEDPAKADPEYRNHAHSDYAEIALEYGALGCLLILGVLSWLARRVLEACRPGEPRLEARTGVMMLALMLAHSAVDYPLRTAALAVMAALAAVLAERSNRVDPCPDRSVELTRPDRLRIVL